jgi:hypothetical protein
MVNKIWSQEIDECSPMERWQSKIRRLRRHMRGWAKNVSGTYKKEKKELLDKLSYLDKKSKDNLLSPHEADLKNCLNSRLAHLLHEEEIKWYQRVKTKNLLKGNSNTKYFHLLANGKHRKTRIYQLQDGNKTITGDKELKKYHVLAFSVLHRKIISICMRLVRMIFLR